MSKKRVGYKKKRIHSSFDLPLSFEYPSQDKCSKGSIVGGIIPTKKFNHSLKIVLDFTIKVDDNNEYFFPRKKITCYILL